MKGERNELDDMSESGRVAIKRNRMGKTDAKGVAMSLVDKIFNLNKAVEDAEDQINQDLCFMQEGQAKDNRKYLLGMLAEIKQVVERHNDILVDLDDSDPIEQHEKLRDRLIYVNDDIRSVKW